jgi:hypothetical protein
VVTRYSNAEWVFLLHRLPREPSAPRIALWRTLRRLGAIVMSDGLVGLPASPRTVEHLQWLAAGIEEQGGTASVWLARPSSSAVGEALAAQARGAIEAEYRDVIREAEAASLLDRAESRRALRRLRGELRRIDSRDFFGAPSSTASHAAVEQLARSSIEVTA